MTKVAGRKLILGRPDDARSGKIEDVCAKGNEQAFRQSMQQMFYRASAGQMQGDTLLALPDLDGNLEQPVDHR